MNGDQLKAQGQAAAASRSDSWRPRALLALREFAAKQRAAFQDFTMDDFRTLVSPVIGEPPSLNAWGSLPRSAIKDGLVQPTGAFRKAQRADAHSRMVRVYRGVVA